MATVLIHLNVKVPNEVAERDEQEAVELAKRKVFGHPHDMAEFDELVAMAEVVDFDE